METNFVCCLCNKIPSNVVESACCHSLFCWDCIVAKPLGQQCPSCGSELDPGNCTENLAVRKIIESIQVKCSHSGCPERMYVVERSAHESTCKKGPALCPNSDLCGIMERGYIPQHLLECQYRRILCHMCEMSLPLPQLQDHLDNACLEVATDCPNLCPTRIPRKNVRAHIDSECPYTEVECPFAAYGCSEKIRKASLSIHIAGETASHMNLMASAIHSQQIQINTLREQLATTQEATSQIPPNTGVVYQLDRHLTQLYEYIQTTQAWNHPCVRKFRESATPKQVIGSILCFFFFIRIIAWLMLPYFLFRLIKWGLAIKLGAIAFRFVRRRRVGCCNKPLWGIGLALFFFFVCF